MAKTAPIAVRLDPEIKAALERAAADDGRSLSGLIAKIVSDWCKKNPQARDGETE